MQRKNSWPSGKGCPEKLYLIFKASFAITLQSDSNYRHITPSQGCHWFWKGVHNPSFYPRTDLELSPTLASSTPP